MSRADDRVRQQIANSTPIADRPNEPPQDRTKIPAADYCPTSKYGVHDYSSFSNDDPPGSGLRSARCWYCRRPSPRSQARIDAWQTACDHKFIDSTTCLKCGWRPPA